MRSSAQLYVQVVLLAGMLPLHTCVLGQSDNAGAKEGQDDLAVPLYSNGKFVMSNLVVL